MGWVAIYVAVLRRFQCSDPGTRTPADAHISGRYRTSTRYAGRLFAVASDGDRGQAPPQGSPRGGEPLTRADGLDPGEVQAVRRLSKAKQWKGGFAYPQRHEAVAGRTETAEIPALNSVKTANLYVISLSPPLL